MKRFPSEWFLPPSGFGFNFSFFIFPFPVWPNVVFGVVPVAGPVLLSVSVTSMNSIGTFSLILL